MLPFTRFHRCLELPLARRNAARFCSKISVSAAVNSFFRCGCEEACEESDSSPELGAELLEDGIVNSRRGERRAERTGDDWCST